MTRWGILTGEYPPQPGGVSDYTKMIAEGLAAAGDLVDIIAPGCEEIQGPSDKDILGKVRVHRLPNGFHYRNFGRVENILAAAGCDRVLLQYVPHAFGWKGMNVPLARWVHDKLGPRLPVDVMFHEVVYPFSWYPLRYALLAQATVYMARQIAAAADRIFVSIPAWGEVVHQLCPQVATTTWLPIPCNMPTTADSLNVTAVRESYGRNSPLIGHFGTYGKLVTDLLTPSLESILAGNRVIHVLLLGRGSVDYRNAFVVKRPEVAERVHAVGTLSENAVASHLRACDVLLQPYPDGVSSRRSSVMPGLACGVAVVTNLGHLSEDFWSERGVAVASRPDPAELATKCLALLCDDLSRQRTATEGRQLYDESFTLERAISVLRDVKRQ